MNVLEIIQKEEEKYRLVDTGVVPRLQDAVKMLEKSCPQAVMNGGDKESVLRYFYRSVVKYASFIEREKATNKTLKKMLFRKSSNFLLTLQKGETALLDKELKTGSQLTVAYQFSDTIFESIYASFCRSAQSFETPDETCSFFLQELKKRYPLYIHEYIGMLELNDASFWEVTCRYLQKLSYQVAMHYPGVSGQNSYHDIVCDETWSKAYEVLKKRLVDREGNVPSFLTGNDFRNYMIKTCRFLADNFHKKYAEKATSFDELLSGYSYNGDANEEEYDLPFEMETAPEPEILENNVKTPDIDTGNPYEVAYAVSIILLNKNHLLYPALVQGMEDKVELLINKAVNDMSYNEIIAASINSNPDEDVFRRAVAKARKDYERTRKILTKRLIDLVEKKQGVNCHIRRNNQML